MLFIATCNCDEKYFIQCECGQFICTNIEAHLRKESDQEI